MTTDECEDPTGKGWDGRLERLVAGLRGHDDIVSGRRENGGEDGLFLTIARPGIRAIPEIVATSTIVIRQDGIQYMRGAGG